MAGPAFQALRERRPDAHITLLVGRSCQDVAQHLPFFDEIWTLDDRALLAGTLRQRLLAAASLLRKLRAATARGYPATPAQRFSEVYVLHRDWRYGLLARLAGIPARVGLDERGASRFLTRTYRPGAREHHTRQYLRLVGVDDSVGSSNGTVAPSLSGTWHFADGSIQTGLAAAARHGYRPGTSPAVALGFGGGRNVKNQTSLKSWSRDRYLELATRLTHEGYRVVWLGDSADAELLGSAPVGVNLSGKLSVEESAAVLQQCAATVANDTLLMHLSQAVGTPTVAIFGPSDPAFYGPIDPDSRWLWKGADLPCSPCERGGFIPPCPYGHRCMDEIGVAEVLEAVKQTLLKSTSESPARAGVGHGT